MKFLHFLDADVENLSSGGEKGFLQELAGTKQLLCGNLLELRGMTGILVQRPVLLQALFATVERWRRLWDDRFGVRTVQRCAGPLPQSLHEAGFWSWESMKTELIVERGILEIGM